MKLSELTPSSGVVIALQAVLASGFKSGYYTDYMEYLQHNTADDLEDESTLDQYAGAWEALDYVSADVWYPVQDGISAKVVQHPQRSNYGDHDEYTVVFALADDENTRYFKRVGWYFSYSGGTLTEDDNVEVVPHQVTITEWRNA